MNPLVSFFQSLFEGEADRYHEWLKGLTKSEIQSELSNQVRLYNNARGACERAERDMLMNRLLSEIHRRIETEKR